MENQLHDESIFSVEVSPLMRQNLTETVKWGKFLAIMGFIGIGIMLLFALIAISSGTAFGGALGGAMGAGIGFVYILIAGLYFYPAYALFKFCTLTRQGLEANNQPLLDEGFRYMKNMFRFAGILTIVILAIYALIFIIGLIAAASL